MQAASLNVAVQKKNMNVANSSATKVFMHASSDLIRENTR
jgi:hypothetical protein